MTGRGDGNLRERYGSLRETTASYIDFGLHLW